MPTYLCTSLSGALSPDQRERIARCLTEIHHEVAMAPRYFVQVIFNDLAPHSHYIGGAAAGPKQIWIRADIRSDRTQEQKEKLLTRIADVVSDIAGSSREDVWVYISDIAAAGVLEFGQVLPPPGQEDAWFASLPQALQKRLQKLA